MSGESSVTVMEDELVEIGAIAFIKILSHSFRFWKKNAKYGENQCVYGFLIGSIDPDKKRRVIKDVEPILHHLTPDFEFKEKFIEDMDDFNLRFIEEGSSDRIVGWYKSVNEPFKFKAIDVKNHLKFQRLNKGNICLVMEPSVYTKGEGYGFSIYSLMGDSYGELNIMSDNYKIPWEINPLGDQKDSTVRFIKELIDNTLENKPFVTELEEY